MLRVLSKIFFWTYPRGCWQYDLMCICILAFIFLTPASVLDGSAFQQAPPADSVQEQRAKVELSRPNPEPKP